MICSTLREVVLIPNRHWGGEGLLGCVFGCVLPVRHPSVHFCNSLASFGLLHRIPPQPEDRVPGTIPVELQEQVDEYESQDLFVPADVESQEGHHSSSQIAEWRRREQEQWNREVLARSAPSQPLPIADNLSDITTNEPPQRFTPEKNDRATPTRSHTSLSHTMNGGSPKRS